MPAVLVISRYFPPLSSAGASIRLVKLMKYSAEQGWSYTVLTQDIDRPVIPEERMSGFLLAEIPVGTEIFRVGNPFFGQGIVARLGRKIVGNSSLPWGFSVIGQGWKKMRHSKPTLILVNSPPFTNVAVGIVLAALFKIPLVVDMKDDWVGSVAFGKKTRLRQTIESWVELYMIRIASAITIATRSSFDVYMRRYASFGLDKKIFLIENGQDLDEYRLLKGRERKPEGKRFLILTAAAGYRPDYRDLTPFLKALELFIDRCPQSRELIEIEFLGEDPDNEYKFWLGKLLPLSLVHYTGAIDRTALVEHLWNADLFFLVQPYKNFTSISGTLYEYWATGKAPVLLFSEKGAPSSLVVSNHLGEHFTFDQIEEASRYIEHILQSHRNGHPVWIEQSGVEEYDRRKLAGKMISIWSTVLKFRSH